MCLSIPGKITKMYQQDSLLMGVADFGGVSREVCLDYVPEAQVGQYVLIHVGFAISVFDGEEALERLHAIRERAELDDEIRSDGNA